MLPPSVPRFCICAPPTSRAAATSIGNRLLITFDAINSRYVVRAPTRTDRLSG